MKKGLSEIICIIDRSGSMDSIRDDAIGGFNTFLEEQKKVEGEANLTYVQFDNEYEIVHENKPIQEVKPINKKTYQPRGSTALHDAVGKTILDVGKRLEKTSEDRRPEKVIVAILTDGEENASRFYDLKSVKAMITTQKNVYNWEFVFLAANQDAFAEGMKFGIDSKDIFAFQATGIGVRSAYGDMSSSFTSYRTSDSNNA